MDRRGEGVPIIIKEGEKLAERRPLYELLDDSELKLTIYAVPSDSVQELYRIADNFTERFTDTAGKVLALIAENPSITQHQIAAICQVSRTTIATALKSLKDNGKIIRLGFGSFW